MRCMKRATSNQLYGYKIALLSCAADKKRRAFWGSRRSKLSVVWILGLECCKAPTWGILEFKKLYEDGKGGTGIRPSSGMSPFANTMRKVKLFLPRVIARKSFSIELNESDVDHGVFLRRHAAPLIWFAQWHRRTPGHHALNSCCQHHRGTEAVSLRWDCFNYSAIIEKPGVVALVVPSSRRSSRQLIDKKFMARRSSRQELNPKAQAKNPWTPWKHSTLLPPLTRTHVDRLRASWRGACGRVLERSVMKIETPVRWGDHWIAMRYNYGHCSEKMVLYRSLPWGLQQISSGKSPQCSVQSADFEAFNIWQREKVQRWRLHW